MKNLYDCHVHLNMNQFSSFRDSLIEECREALDFCINVGYDEQSSEASLLLAYRHPFIKAAVGLHPSYAAQGDQRFMDRLNGMLAEDEAAALGEIGLDYYWMKDPPHVQKKVFMEQMEIAALHKKPVIIHDRESHEDTVEILKAFNGRVRGVLHSFSGDRNMASTVMDMGYYLSISGPVTFQNKKNIPFREIVASLPADRLLIETDSPYLAPVPFRGKTNTPLNVSYVAREISLLINMDLQRFLELSRSGARELFGI
jgi:TatD DNase family protein